MRWMRRRRRSTGRAPFQTRGVRVARLLLASAVISLVAVGEAAAQSTSPPSRYSVESDGHPIAVWARVPAQAQAVVVLHHGRTWSSLPDFDLEVPGEDLSLMVALADSGVAVYAMDARGYGETPRDETGWLTPDRMAEDLAEVVRWVRTRHPLLPAPVLMGWSFGSTAVHLMAQRDPALVSGVALYGYWRAPSNEIPVADDPSEPPRARTTEAAARSDFITPGSISDAAIEAFVFAALSADPIRVDVARLHEFNALDPALLTMPVLILQGELDPLAPESVQAELFAGLGTGDKEWIVMGGCDHAAHLESCRPRFVGTLLRFVWEHARGR